MSDTKELNLSILRTSTLPFKFSPGGTVTVREKGYPTVDFYPAKNEWTANGRAMTGDAQALIDWLWLQGPKRGRVGR